MVLENTDSAKVPATYVEVLLHFKKFLPVFVVRYIHVRRAAESSALGFLWRYLWRSFDYSFNNERRSTYQLVSQQYADGLVRTRHKSYHFCYSQALIQQSLPFPPCKG